MKYDYNPKPPEWWTAENTAAWEREQWGPNGRQGTWGEKIQRTEITGGKSLKAGAACYRPIPPEVMAQWRVNDPRPSNPCYFDGTPILSYQPLPLKAKRRSRKQVAA